MSKESLKGTLSVPENFAKVRMEQLEMQNKSLLAEIGRLKKGRKTSSF